MDPGIWIKCQCMKCHWLCVWGFDRSIFGVGESGPRCKVKQAVLMKLISSWKSSCSVLAGQTRHHFSMTVYIYMAHRVQNYNYNLYIIPCNTMIYPNDWDGISDVWSGVLIHADMMGNSWTLRQIYYQVFNCYLQIDKILSQSSQSLLRSQSLSPAPSCRRNTPVSPTSSLNRDSSLNKARDSSLNKARDSSLNKDKDSSLNKPRDSSLNKDCDSSHKKVRDLSPHGENDVGVLSQKEADNLSQPAMTKSRSVSPVPPRGGGMKKGFKCPLVNKGNLSRFRCKLFCSLTFSTHYNFTFGDNSIDLSSDVDFALWGSTLIELTWNLKSAALVTP